MGSGSGRKLTFVPDQPDEQQLGIHGRHATTPLACRRTVRVEIEDHGRSAASMCMRRRSTAQSLHNYYVRGVSWVIWMRIFIRISVWRPGEVYYCCMLIDRLPD